MMRIIVMIITIILAPCSNMYLYSQQKERGQSVQKYYDDDLEDFA